MNTADIDILTLIPQRPPFVMVDRLTHFSPETTVTQMTVREDNLFVQEGRLAFTGIIENIAQTCAVRMGCINSIRGEKVKIGVIGSIQDFQYTYLPTVGETLTTRIDVEEEVFNVVLVRATVTVGEKPVATARMKIALTDTDSQQ